eukprot:CAMPEP_0206596164 /NCGR_PEP_ID=MMETSP0325_2-20121206/43399_1 /ASSEMBLY_ACC=CAM_ASM_000347 /TAXON_ID=2866 /ORGANISM="Crypthecodinium cohnii, Strain Seligo" /LENGTH=97 /DNA_ID=CAMNT_0054106949 /DNA_START=81 /DNA_END=375 /DNA_ORIENTATION=+
MTTPGSNASGAAMSERLKSDKIGGASLLKEQLTAAATTAVAVTPPTNEMSTRSRQNWAIALGAEPQDFATKGRKVYVKICSGSQRATKGIAKEQSTK